MNTICHDMDALIAERAAGALSRPEAARLEAHLEGCASCRESLAAYEQLFALAKAPGVPKEAPELARSTLLCWKILHRRRLRAMAVGGGMAVAAAALLALAPPFLGWGRSGAHPHARMASNALAVSAPVNARSSEGAGAIPEVRSPVRVAVASRALPSSAEATAPRAVAVSVKRSPSRPSSEVRAAAKRTALARAAKSAWKPDVDGVLAASALALREEESETTVSNSARAATSLTSSDVLLASSARDDGDSLDPTLLP